MNTDHFTVSSFEGDRVTEYFIASKRNYGTSGADALKNLQADYDKCLQSLSLTGDAEVWIKLYVEDMAGHKSNIEEFKRARGKSFVLVLEQPPVCGRRIALEAYLISGDETRICRHFGVAPSGKEGVREQTIQAFEHLFGKMRASGVEPKDGLVRTWLYLRDIDGSYGDMVAARRDVFFDNGLNPDTNFVASTGIGVNNTELNTDLTLMYLWMEGLEPRQMEHIRECNEMGPPMDYDVTFERATKVRYRDRAKVFVSGTASIDSQGEVFCVGDLRGQLDRTLENISDILKTGNANMSDIKCMTVYLRNITDGEIVESYLQEHFQNVSRVVVEGKVCRPEWLVEIECVAVTDESGDFPDF